MNFFVKLLYQLWNLSPNLVSDMVKRSSTNNLVMNQNELPNRWPTWRLALYFYLCFAVIRFWAASLVLSTGNFRTIQQYDVLMNISMDAKVINFYAALCFSPLTVFIIHFDWTMYVKHFNSIIRLCHEVMVVNAFNFLSLNPQIKPDLNLMKQSLFQFLKKLVNTFIRLYNSKEVVAIQWAVPTLTYFSHISEIIRRRALLLTWLLQLFISVFLIGTGILVHFLN